MNEGYNVDVLVFDGCMVRKDENKEITDELLNRLSVYICEKTGYKIEFVEKDLDKSIRRDSGSIPHHHDHVAAAIP